MKVIRGIEFFFKGYFNFTKQDKPLPPLQGSLDNINYIITGANSGIGLAAAKFAASRNANVYIVCRNQERGREAVQEIVKNSGNQKVRLIIGEVGDRESMEKIVREVQQHVGRIDVLVHNAGVMNNQYKETKDGIESNYATNVFGVYYLTQKLIPNFHNNTKTIVVSSGGMYTSPLINQDIYMKKDFDGTTQYARNKRMQVVMVEQFSKLYPNSGVFVSMHPGWVDTPGVVKSMPSFHEKMKGKLKNVDEGCDTINYLALQNKQKLKNGEFYYDRQVADKYMTLSGTKYSQKDADQMMAKLRELAGF